MRLVKDVCGPGCSGGLLVLDMKLLPRSYISPVERQQIAREMICNYRELYKLVTEIEMMRKIYLLYAVCSLIVIVGILLSVTRLVNSRTLHHGNSRTLYHGTVDIEPTSLDVIKQNLNEQGCQLEGTRTNGSQSRCVYYEIESDEPAIRVYPKGPGFGPHSFDITPTMLAATKDISGRPNSDKYKEAVRQEVRELGNFVILKEGSWKIDTKFPWNAIY